MAESALCDLQGDGARQKERQKRSGEKISRLCAFAYILPGLLSDSDLEAD
jgi:hypothetical protein